MWRRVDMRTAVSLMMVILGFTLSAVSYFFLAAPIGQPTSPAYSDPRLPFAPLFFIAGIALVFLAAVAYEIMPEKKSEESEAQSKELKSPLPPVRSFDK
jgi:uncharacterized membrane protein YedE/YeeE